MDTATELDGRIRDVMADILEVEPGDIGDGFGRGDAPSWDSMNHLRMVSALEEAFGVQFTMKEVGEMERFDTIRRLVSGRLQGR
ncbi:MAG TPA: acyl carrier protein [Thermoanaerobaculia bacterium]|nr:acyl carrier protein [Thermoanaerobaculia bacterium]